MAISIYTCINIYISIYSFLCARLGGNRTHLTKAEPLPALSYLLACRDLAGFPPKSPHPPPHIDPKIRLRALELQTPNI